MNTAGYIFALVGVLLIRQVVTGRAKDTPSDLRDLSIAFLSGDVDGMRTVLTQRGNNVGAVSGEVATGTAPTPNNVLAKKVVELGSNAKGYRLGATGPEYYDCSGLVWKASRALGVFNGARFTTHNFKLIARPTWVQVDSPQEGDIVLWSGKHMGISLGGDSMYSARSTSKGIGVSTVSGDTKYFGYQPTYWRMFVGPIDPRVVPNG